jgi:WD40 repeat protein
MRLLPTTSRGTYILAGAVWLAGVVVTNSLLPAVPRAVIPADQAGFPLLFSGDGTKLLVRDYGSVSRQGYYSVKDGFINTPGPLLDGPLKLFDTSDGRLVAAATLGPGDCHVLALSPDGRTAAVIDRDGGASSLLNLSTGRQHYLPRFVTDLAGYEATFSPDGRYFIFGTREPDHGPICWWDVKREQVERVGQSSPTPAFSPDGRWLVAPVDRGNGTTFEIRAWPSGPRKSLRDLGGTHSLRLSEDAHYLLVDQDGSTYILDCASGEQRLRLPWVSKLILLTGQDRVAALASDETTLRLTHWDLKSGQCLGWRRLSLPTPPEGSEPEVHVAAPHDRFGLWLRGEWSPTALDEWLATVPLLYQLSTVFEPIWRVRAGGCYIVLDAKTGSEVCRLDLGHAQHAELSPDGTTILAVGHDGRLEFWDVPPRRPWVWLAVAAAFWALPLLWFARRRVRRLRAANA